MAAQAGCRAGPAGEVVELERASYSPAYMPHWELLSPPNPGNETFYRVRITDDGRRGWLAARTGSLFQNVDGAWVERDPLPLAAAGTLALEQNGESGWAVGRRGAVMRYGARRWEADEAASRLTAYDLNDICLSADGSAGWAVGDHGTMLKYSASTWSAVPAVAQLLGAAGLSQIWCSQDATAAWAAAASPATPWMIGLQGGAWQTNSQLQARGMWVASQQSAWASSGSLITYFNRKWTLNYVVDPADSAGSILSFWSSPDGQRMWAAGGGGRMQRRQDFAWQIDAQFRGLTTSTIHSLWLTPTETDGWAVGEQGRMLRFRPISLGKTARLEPVGAASITRLSGDFNLVLPADATTFPNLSLVARADGISRPLAQNELNVKYADSADHRVLRISFTPAAAEHAEQFHGTDQSLSLAVTFEHPSMFPTATFSSRPFTMVGPSAWRKAALAALGVVLLNLLLFLGAIRVRWLRRVALHPVGSAVFGLVLGKYLLTDWMIRFVRPLKLAMFRDYRRQMAASDAIAKWQAKPDPYVPPAVELPPGGEPTTADPESAWKQAFERLLAAPRQRLWLVQGPSGLGKTALLEKWAALALSRGRTPLLIRLRRGEARHEAAALMSQLGDVDVKDDVAFDLLTGGGFVLLLDGLNEDRAPDVTRDFVRRVAQRNLVVLTSQYDPGWSEEVHVDRIELREFGASQLRKLLDEQWAVQILASPQLASIARLPVTAKLLAEFVKRSGRLPADRLQIYASLVAELEEGKLLNLEEKAWLLFKNNEFDFAPDSGLPAEFCDAAVARGALTRRQGDRYGFPHDMVQRYLIAQYLDSCERRPLADWHREIKAGLKRSYWIEVLDFRGEMWGRRAAADRRELAGYEDFLREGAGFSREIFGARLYPHYDALCAAGALGANEANADFIAWAARVLAGAVRSEEVA